MAESQSPTGLKLAIVRLDKTLEPAAERPGCYGQGIPLNNAVPLNCSVQQNPESGVFELVLLSTPGTPPFSQRLPFDDRKLEYYNLEGRNFLRLGLLFPEADQDMVELDFGIHRYEEGRLMAESLYHDIISLDSEGFAGLVEWN